MESDVWKPFASVLRFQKTENFALKRLPFSEGEKFGDKKMISYFRKNKRLQVFILFALLLWSVNTYRYFPNSRNDKCYKSFREFAYKIPERENRQERFLPLEPWKVESPLPEGWGGSTVKIARKFNNHAEIWIASRKLCVGCYDQIDAENYRFAVYRTDTKEWKTIPAQVNGGNIFVRDLFVRSDGSLWGDIIWDEFSDVNNPPPLVRYNEKTQSFDFVVETQEIPSAWKSSPKKTSGVDIYWSNTILDKNGVFWIFAQFDGIYSYNPDTQEIKFHADIKDREVVAVALSPDGSVYFEKHYNSVMGFQLEDEEFFQFNQEKNEIKNLGRPIGPWPGFGSMLIDNSNRVWFGAVGYRDKYGIWHLFYPRVAAYTWGLGLDGSWTYYDQPDIFMQSSDGRLWFIIPESDFSGVKSGIAWLNPKTNEGCWFTSDGENIVEDSDKNLWLIAGRDLYKYPLAKTTEEP